MDGQASAARRGHLSRGYLRTMRCMSDMTIVRLFAATRTDDGYPLLFGVGGDEDTWSVEEFEAVQTDLSTVLNFGANEPFGVAQFALTGFCRRHDEIVAAARAGERPDESSFRELQVFLYAFLTAMRSFLDQADRKLKQQFGENSVQREALKTHAKVEYDGSSAYRFVYDLRNHVQHHSVPLGPSLGRSTLVTTEDGENQVEHQLRITCSRERLLADRRFKPIVTEWLSKQDAQFEIVPLLMSCMDSLRNIRIEYDRRARIFSRSRRGASCSSVGSLQWPPRPARLCTNHGHWRRQAAHRLHGDPHRQISTNAHLSPAGSQCSEPRFERSAPHRCPGVPSHFYQPWPRQSLTGSGERRRPPIATATTHVLEPPQPPRQPAILPPRHCPTRTRISRRGPAATLATAGFALPPWTFVLIGGSQPALSALA